MPACALTGAARRHLITLSRPCSSLHRHRRRPADPHPHPKDTRATDDDLGDAVAAVLAAVSLAACGSSSDKAGGSPKTLTYWASNQGTSLDNDKQILQPELDKFTQQTGIKVNVEVVRWPDLLNRHPRRHHLRQGPGRAQHRQHLVGLAAGHRRAAAVRRRDLTKRRRQGPLPGPAASPPPARPASRRPPCRSTAWPTGSTTTRRCSPTPASTSPPATWDELVADGKKLTNGEQWGLALEGGQRDRERPPRLHPQPAVRRRVLRLGRQADLRHPAERRGDQAVPRPHGRRQDRQPERRRVLRQNQSRHRLRHRQGRDAAVAGRGRLAQARRA